MTKKKKLIIGISAVLVLAIAGTVFAVVRNANKGVPVTLYTVGTGDVTSTLTATADLESGNHREYRVGTAATIKDVFVKVGDKVAKGTVLATFDTSSLDEQISSLGKQYNSAQASYNNSLKSQNQAKKELKALQKEISALEKSIQQKQSATTTKKANTTLPSISLPSGDLTPEQIKAIVDQMDLPQEVKDALYKYLVSGSNADLSDLINKLPSAGVDYEKLAEMLGAGNSTMTDELKLTALNMKKQLLETQASTTLTDAQKESMKLLVSSRDSLVKQKNELGAGWVAETDGVVSQVNVTPGSMTTLVQAGIVMEGTTDIKAVITLGKYDIPKVKIGQKARVKVVGGEYEGVVSFINPVASSSSSAGDLLSSVGDMAGLGGLGSLGGSSSGLRCEITIQNPGDDVVIGLDADVEIDTSTVSNVVTIPSEAMKMDKTGNYCFIYDAEEKTVSVRQLTLGTSSDMVYEVKSGLKAGDKIVANPGTDVTDGVRVKVEATKAGGTK